MPGVSNEFEGRWDRFDKQALILTLRHWLMACGGAEQFFIRY